MPGRLVEYLTESDCRTFGSLKILNDERLERQWKDPTEQCREYDFQGLSDALQYAYNMHRILSAASSITIRNRSIFARL